MILHQEDGGLYANFEDLGFESELVGMYEDAYGFYDAISGNTLTATFWRDASDKVSNFVTLKGIATRQEE